MPASSVSLPVTSWDMGAAGPANRRGLEPEDAGEPGQPNPNGVRRMRRVDLLEYWHRRGTISTAGFNAAVKLRDAFQRTQRGQGIDYTRDKVDASPKPDHAVTIQIDRLSEYHRIVRLVIRGDMAIIDATVLREGTPHTLRRYRGDAYQAGLRHMAEALDRLARALDRS